VKGREEKRRNGGGRERGKGKRGREREGRKGRGRKGGKGEPCHNNPIVCFRGRLIHAIMHNPGL